MSQQLEHICKDCGKKIDKFPHSLDMLESTQFASKIEVVHLMCPHCTKRQYTLTSVNPIIELSKRVESLEQIIKELRKTPTNNQ